MIKLEKSYICGFSCKQYFGDTVIVTEKKAGVKQLAEQKIRERHECPASCKVTISNIREFLTGFQHNKEDE